MGKQAHWNIVGPNFRDLHLNLDEVVDIAREGADEIAERMRAINATPDGRPATVAAATTVPAAAEGEILTTEGVEYIVSAIEAVVATLRPPPASSRTSSASWSSRPGSSPPRCASPCADPEAAGRAPHGG